MMIMSLMPLTCMCKKQTARCFLAFVYKRVAGDCWIRVEIKARASARWRRRRFPSWIKLCATLAQAPFIFCQRRSSRMQIEKCDCRLRPSTRAFWPRCWLRGAGGASASRSRPTTKHQCRAVQPTPSASCRSRRTCCCSTASSGASKWASSSPRRLFCTSSIRVTSSHWCR